MTFSVGSIVRYAAGPTALMKVSRVRGKIGYGVQCLGGPMCVNLEVAEETDAADRHEWESHRPWRWGGDDLGDKFDEEIWP